MQKILCLIIIAANFAYAMEENWTHFPSTTEIKIFKSQKKCYLIFGVINTEMEGKFGEDAKHWMPVSDEYESYGDKYTPSSSTYHNSKEGLPYIKLDFNNIGHLKQLISTF